MRKVLLITNGIVAVFFLAAFLYTFLGREHLTEVARTYVTGKTAKAAESTVDLAEKALKSSIVQQLAPKAKSDKVAEEIEAYRADPSPYIAQLTGKLGTKLDSPTTPASLAKLADWKQKVRAFYNRTLDQLLLDIRIFTGSNFVAAVLAFAIAYRAQGKVTKDVCWVSALLVIAMGLSIYIYSGQFSLFSILSGSLLGWCYPALIAFFFAYMYLDFRLQAKRSDLLAQANKAST